MHQALCGMEEGPAEAFWVRISRQANRGDIVVNVSYRLPYQEVDNFKQLKPGPWGYFVLQRFLPASNCGFVLHSAF